MVLYVTDSYKNVPVVIKEVISESDVKSAQDQALETKHPADRQLVQNL